MKSIAIALLLIAFLGLLAYTNPRLENYDQFISQRMIEKSRQQKDPLAGAFGALFGDFAARLLTKQTLRKDYVFFSTYDTAFGNRHMQAIGILNNFYLTEESASIGDN